MQRWRDLTQGVDKAQNEALKRKGTADEIICHPFGVSVYGLVMNLVKRRNNYEAEGASPPLIRNDATRATTVTIRVITGEAK